MVDGRKETDFCGCQFNVGEDGRPELLCETEAAQVAAFDALRKFPDIAVRVLPVVVPAGAVGSTDSVVQAPVDDDVAAGDELADGFVDADDFGDFDFDYDGEE